MRISDWSSDVCSSDLHERSGELGDRGADIARTEDAQHGPLLLRWEEGRNIGNAHRKRTAGQPHTKARKQHLREGRGIGKQEGGDRRRQHRSEEHTSELQSLMRISYAVFCLKKKQ